MKVLVVDEVGYTCYVHTRLLEELGYEVICASSGFEALSILEMDSEIKIMFSELVMRELSRHSVRFHSCYRRASTQTRSHGRKREQANAPPMARPENSRFDDMAAPARELCLV